MIIERIAHRKFTAHEQSGILFSESSDLAIIVRRAKDWWKSIERLGEKKTLLKGIRLGDFNSPEQARRLAKLDSTAAINEIVNLLRCRPRIDSRVYEALLEFLETGESLAANDLLKDSLNHSRLSTRIIAMRALLHKGRFQFQSDDVRSLIQSLLAVETTTEEGVQLIRLLLQSDDSTTLEMFANALPSFWLGYRREALKVVSNTIRSRHLKMHLSNMR